MTDEIKLLSDIGWELPYFEEVQINKKRSEYALVIPVINEGLRIQKQLLELKKHKFAVDIVIADGGSNDGSVDVSFLKKTGATILLIKRDNGKLSAQLRIAYAWCLKNGYEGIITVDGNGKDGLSSIEDMRQKLAEGYDYIQGSRYLPGGSAQNTPLFRTIANRLIHAPLISLSAGVWFTDTTNGFRAYSKSFLLDPRVLPFRDVFRDYELLFYLSIRAGQLKKKIFHQPVARSYPKREPVPTKISGIGGNFKVLKQTILTVFGVYNVS